MTQMPSILITGSGGMVGRNIVEALEPDGYVLYTPRSRQLDLMDQSAVNAFLHRHKPSLVIHCAGKVGGIQANMAAPVDFLYENMQMGLNIAMGALKQGIKLFLNMGSSCMYPTQAPNPLTEDLVLTGSLEPTNEGYAIAKCAITRLCQYISKQYPGRNYKTLVPCNLYGKYDSFDPFASHMIPAIIRKIDTAVRDGLDTVEIWGNGEARREFMYAEDLAQLVLVAVRNFDALPGIMNVGLGYDYSVNEYYQAVARVLNYQGAFSHDLSKPAGMQRKLVDVSRQKAFGFSPHHTLEEGIRKTHDYYTSL
ncbi:GDP-L-fucose synthase [Desulfovibrio sp.]|uniref:GDP-L-fucose synthase family protein n=1 Tax=Desulfovibrio sp. TaxID=885 RepID=UPI0025C5B0EF|nr:GDP-L-fucose synthase [Desulfovibrio sp.]